MVYGAVAVLLEKGLYSFVMRQMLLERRSKLYVTSWCELWAPTKRGPIISVAFVHTQT
jgi:hypothetical protein